MRASAALAMCLALGTSIVRVDESPLWNRRYGALELQNRLVTIIKRLALSANPLDISNLDRETSAMLTWKRQQFNWGLLQGLWRSR